MITDASCSLQNIFVRLLRGSAVVGSIVLIWFTSMAAIVVFTDVAPAALVITPNQKVLTNLPLHTKLLRSGEHVMVLTSEEPGHALSLYRAGAWLVLPALRNGCFGFSPNSIVRN